MKKWIPILLIGLGLSFGIMSHAADVNFKPYGFVLVNANYNSDTKADVPVKVGLTDDSSNFLITPRQTRFGFRMTYEQDWKVSAVIEMDFFGLKGSGANGGVMQSAPRLRLANMRLQKNDLSFVIGQDWVLFAPLNPTSMMHVSIPKFSSSGNLWNRFPQLRAEYKLKLDEKNSLLLQGAVLRPLGADVTPTVNQTDELGAGEQSDFPFLQMRLAADIGPAATVGASVHYGQEDFYKAWNGGKKVGDVTYAIKNENTSTFALAGDTKLKFGIATLSAEAYWGKNLTMLFGNAYLKSEAASNGEYKIDGVGSAGGWAELAVKPKNSKFTLGVGLGYEALKEGDVDSLTTDDLFKSATPMHTNMTIFALIGYSPFSNFTCGLEINHIQTGYKKISGGTLVGADAKNTSVGLAFKFDF